MASTPLPTEDVVDDDDIHPDDPAFSVLVPSDRSGERLDRYLAEQLQELSRSEIQRLIDTADAEGSGVLVNGSKSKSGYRIRSSDLITVRKPAPKVTAILPEAIPLEIVFEDRHMLVINKPRGMVVHPAPGSASGTLVNAVMAHCDDLSGIGGEIRPGIVHRLDKDTGGLIMVAKTDAAHRSLQAQIQARTATRIYQALVWGNPQFEHAVIDAPIGRHPVDRKKMAVITDAALTARNAVTEISVISRYVGCFALIEAKLQTGRTHQIRVHSAYAHHPVVGDPLYTGARKLPGDAFGQIRSASLSAAIDHLAGQALHAVSLSFDHPDTGERLSFVVNLPDPVQRLVELLEEYKQT